jgi:hypothetical protein
MRRDCDLAVLEALKILQRSQAMPPAIAHFGRQFGPAQIGHELD